MNSDVLVAIITGSLALIGTAIGTFGGIKTSNRINEVKIEELTREVREHNNFAKRMPVIEEKMKNVIYRVSELERRQ